MKKYKLIYLMIILTFIGCDDFLEEEPVDEVALEQYFTEPEHARDAVNSLYRTGASQLYTGPVYAGSRIMFGPYISGFVDNEYKGQEVHVARAQELTYDEANLSTYFNGMWSDMYLGISRANTALKYIPEIPAMTEEQSAQYMAEARFFRALNYFYLVRFFGGVPLITAPYETIGDLEIERSRAIDIYNFILEDLNTAINSGGLPSSSMPSNGGRITKQVAQTLLADAYLTMSGAAVEENNYAQAAEAAREVINSGIYELTSHSFSNGDLIENGSAYNKNRQSKIVENEHIYYYEYAIGIANSTYSQWTFPTALSPEMAYAIVNNAYKPTEDLLNSYDPERDLRAQEKQFFHTSITTPDGELLEFEPSPYIWLDEQANFETATSENATPIYTYSNVLLMGAEAIARSEGVTSEAVDLLARVRERAYWNDDPAAIRADIAGLSEDAFVEEVLKERIRELAFEFQIWFDVLRTRKFPVPSAEQPGQINFVDAIGATNTFGGTISETSLLLPIPELEMQRNPSLNQNPGY